MSDWYILGGGGHAKVILDSLIELSIPVLGFFDDDPHKKSLGLGKVERLGSIADSRSFKGKWVVGIGNNTVRRHIAESIEHSYYEVIHPRAIVSANTVLGKGTVVLGGAVINSDVTVGVHVIINTSSSVDHDSFIGDYVHIGPGVTLCGGVTVGSDTLIGAGATIIPGIKIGKRSTIGAGS
ncbi:MAG: acetyltransferase, partial [Saprospiraceae bacterium]|nr:acetyltransferase [Saprospiraceae bacterium]